MKNGKYVKRRGVATKTMMIVLAVMLVVGCSIGGTLAWLTAESNEVTNTFTVGDINITLAESTGTDYKIVPGAKVEKDPTITVEFGSEKCYVYALVENIVKLNGTAVAVPQINNTWVTVASSGDKTLYRYTTVVDASEKDAVLDAVFSTVKYSDTITKDNIDDLTNTTITIKGYAHQSENTTQTVADAAAKDWAFNETATN